MTTIIPRSNSVKSSGLMDDSKSETETGITIRKPSSAEFSSAIVSRPRVLTSSSRVYKPRSKSRIATLGSSERTPTQPEETQAVPSVETASESTTTTESPATPTFRSRLYDVRQRGIRKQQGILSKKIARRLAKRAPNRYNQIVELVEETPQDHPLKPYLTADGGIDIVGAANALGDDKTSELLWGAGLYLTPKVVEIIRSGMDIPSFQDTLVKAKGKYGKGKEGQEATVTEPNFAQTMSINDWASLYWMLDLTYPKGEQVKEVTTKRFGKTRISTQTQEEAPVRGGWAYAVVSKVGSESDLKPEFLDWYNTQKNVAMAEMSAAETKIEELIAKAKETYDRPDQRDKLRLSILKIKRDAYPKWSDQYPQFYKAYYKLRAALSRKAAKEAAREKQERAEAIAKGEVAVEDMTTTELKKFVSDDAISSYFDEHGYSDTKGFKPWLQSVAAPKVTTIKATYEAQLAEKEKFESVPIEISINATEEELNAAATSIATGTSCPNTVGTYKITTRDGNVVLVEALGSGHDSQTGKDNAVSKYLAAHPDDKIMYVSKVVGNMPVYPKWKPEETTINLYSVNTQNGPKNIEAVDEAQAIRIAQGYGLVVSGVTLKGQNSYTQEELAQKLIRSGGTGEALIKYQVTDPRIQVLYFGEEISFPSQNSVPVRIGKDYYYLNPSDVRDLESMPFYSTAKGDPGSKLSKTLAESQKQFDTWLTNLQNNDPEAYKIYEKNGVEGVSAYYENQARIIDNISGFEITNDNGEIGYDLVGIAAAGNATDSDLKAIGFNSTAVDKAFEQAEELLGSMNVFDKFLIPYVPAGYKGDPATYAEVTGDKSWDFKRDISRDPLFGIEPTTETSLAETVTGLSSSEVNDLWNAMKMIGVAGQYNIGGTPLSKSIATIWAGLDKEGKIKVMNAYNSFPSGGEGWLAPAFRNWTIMHPDVHPAAGLSAAMITGIPSGIAQPFYKDYVASFTENMSKCAVTSQCSGGTCQVDGYDLTKYLEENPYDGSFLGQIGFNEKDIEKAAQGEQVVALPTGATSKDWAMSALIMGSLAAGGIGGVIGGIGRTATIASGLARAQGVALGFLMLPDTIAVMKNPESPAWQKGLAGSIQGLLFAPLMGPIVRSMQGISVKAQLWRYIPMRSLAIEAWSTRFKLLFTEKQLAAMKAAGYTEAKIIAEGTRIVKQLSSGAKQVVVKMPGGKTITIKNIQYQRYIGDATFHMTPDGRLIIRGSESSPVIRDLHSGPKVAIEPGQRSYLTGMKSQKPAIIEIRADPKVIAELFPQERNWFKAGKSGEPEMWLEPEVIVPSLDRLAGMGYRIELVPGKGSHAITFDATIGKVDIYRARLLKVTDNPQGLIHIKTNGAGRGGVTAISDPHATTNYAGLYDSINSGFRDPFIVGDKAKPETWHYSASSLESGRTIAILGDMIDGGPLSSYRLLRETFNRLNSEAKVSGDRVIRLAGNHELAWLSRDAIGGVKYTDALRAEIKAGLKEDILNGDLQAAFSSKDTLYTHAGINKALFPEYIKKTSDFIANDLNKKFLNAVNKNNFKGKLFSKGREEWNSSKIKNNRQQGGIFWLRPQEAPAGGLDFGFRQVVGHNPGFDVRRAWGQNFYEVDINAKAHGRVGAYFDTDFINTQPVDILTEPIPYTMPQINLGIRTQLAMRAMRDTIADFFIGWDGRIRALDRLKENEIAVRELQASLKKQIAERIKAGDTVGAEWLENQLRSLNKPGLGDYVYGGMDFWRDFIMGRQNSVKVRDVLPKATPAQLIGALGLVNTARSQISQLSNNDVQQMFGMSKEKLLSILDTSKIDKAKIENYRAEIGRKLGNYITSADVGLERSVARYLDSEKIVKEYGRRLQAEYDRARFNGYTYDGNRYPAYRSYDPYRQAYQSYLTRNNYADNVYYNASVYGTYGYEPYESTAYGAYGGLGYVGAMGPVTMPPYPGGPYNIPVYTPYDYPKPRPRKRLDLGGEKSKRHARIVVKAKIDGADYEGALSYELQSRNAKIEGVRVAETFEPVMPETYTLKNIEGAPARVVDVIVSPSKTRTLGAGDSVTYVIEMSTKPIYERVKKKSPGLVARMPVVAGLGGVIAGDVKLAQSIAGIKQVAPITPSTEVVVGTRKLGYRDYDYDMEKHGLHSSYIKKPKEKKEKEHLSKEEFMDLKPEKMDKNLWEKAGHLKQGVELLTEGEEELIPYGKKKVKTVKRVVTMTPPGLAKKATAQLGKINASRKISGKVLRKAVGWGRYYLGRQLPEGQIGDIS